MDGVDPLIAPAGVDLLIPEHHPLGAVGVEGPGVPVGGLSRPRHPGPLQRLPPAGVKHLVQVGADADIGVCGHQLQGAVPGPVKAPGGDCLHSHLRPPGPQPLHRVVLRAGVQHYNLVRLQHGVHPAVYKLFLIFTDGVDTYLVAAHKDLL